MLGLLHAQGAAESNASVRLRVRSHVPGVRRDRAQAVAERIRKAKPQIETPSVGIRRWAVFKRGSAQEPPPENVGRERDVARPQARRAAVRPGCASRLGSRSDGEHVRSVYAPEPPWRIFVGVALQCERTIVLGNYSYCRAIFGSILSARRAGIYVASREVAVSTTTVTTILARSTVLTP
jgi:hypothetical protein